MNQLDLTDYLQNIPLSLQGIHILLSGTGNHLKNGPHYELQRNPLQIQSNSKF